MEILHRFGSHDPYLYGGGVVCRDPYSGSVWIEWTDGVFLGDDDGIPRYAHTAHVYAVDVPPGHLRNNDPVRVALEWWQYCSTRHWFDAAYIMNHNDLANRWGFQPTEKPKGSITEYYYYI